MVQIALYAGFGFLLALLLVLIVSPFLRRRTVRLTERRMLAELPQSMEEIRADRDSLRADYAMRVRQLEIKLEKVHGVGVQNTLLLEERNEKLSTLKTEIRQKLEIIAELGDELDDQRNLSREKDEELARAKSKVRDLSGRLERKLKELERAESRFGDMEAMIEKQRSDLIDARTSLRDAERSASVTGKIRTNASNAVSIGPDGAGRVDPPLTSRPSPDTMFEERVDMDGNLADLQIKITELEAAKFAAELRARTTENELFSVEGQMGKLEEQLARLQADFNPDSPDADDEEKRTRIFDLEAQIGELESDLAAKESRIAALTAASDLTTSGSDDTDVVVALRSRLLDVEAEKSFFEAEVTRLSLELETATAAGGTSDSQWEPRAADELRTMQQDLETALADRDRAVARAEDLSRELADRERAPDRDLDIEHAELARVRESLSELAAEVTHIVMTLEGEQSPVANILSTSNGHANGGGSSGGSSGAMISLADRIRSLRDRAATPH